MHKRPEEMMNMLLNLRNTLTARELLSPSPICCIGHSVSPHSPCLNIRIPCGPQAAGLLACTVGNRQYLVSSAVAETVFSYPLPAVTVRRGF